VQIGGWRMSFRRARPFWLFSASLSCLIAFAFLLAPRAYGQGRRPATPTPPSNQLPNSIDQYSPAANLFDLAPVHVVLDDNGKAIATSEYTCFRPPLNSVSPATVGVVDLQVPSEPKNDYQEACQSLHKNKPADAEKHLRKAVEHYEKYAAAWILLGQVLEGQKKLGEANDACAKSLAASSSYLPGLLCLTEISTRQEHWLDALKFSTRALEIDPTSTPVAYTFSATANLELHHLAEAEASALRALAMDVKNSEPRVHYLLARIYAAKGDRTNFVAQLQEFVKYSKDPADVAVAKNLLAKLESQSQPSQPQR
jgi:tetratricopeptide (TPR) repeat protein